MRKSETKEPVRGKWGNVHDAIRTWHEVVENKGMRGESAEDAWSQLDELMHQLIELGSWLFKADME